jgi:hypothetical protein
MRRSLFMYVSCTKNSLKIRLSCTFELTGQISIVPS